MLGSMSATGIFLISRMSSAVANKMTPPTTFIRKTKSILAALWPFILIATVYMALRATVLNFNNSFNFYNSDTAFTTHFDMRLATFFKVLALYAGFIFTPLDSDVMYATSASLSERCSLPLPMWMR